jgi:hypothetical protein
MSRVRRARRRGSRSASAFFKSGDRIGALAGKARLLLKGEWLEERERVIWIITSDGRALRADGVLGAGGVGAWAAGSSTISLWMSARNHNELRFVPADNADSVLGAGPLPPAAVRGLRRHEGGDTNGNP